jgi:hypothetical protein
MKLSRQDIQLHYQMGIAALLPGVRKFRDDIVAFADEYVRQFEEQLYALQGGEPLEMEALMGKTFARSAGPGRRKVGRPKKEAARVRPSGWSADPNERKAEMRRRMAKRKAKAATKLHPRDVDHPDHAQWLAKLRSGMKRRWRGLSPKEREAHLQRMTAARKARALPTVKMEPAA